MILIAMISFPSVKYNDNVLILLMDQIAQVPNHSY